MPEPTPSGSILPVRCRPCACRGGGALSSHLALAGLWLLSAPPLSAQQPSLLQELSVFAVVSASDHAEFPSSGGVGASAQWRFGGSWLARLSYQKISDETKKMGLVCTVYSPRVGCREEVTENAVNLGGLRGGIQRTLHLGDHLRLGAGGGLSFSQVNASAVGVSGGKADMLVPNAGQIGYHVILSALIKPLQEVPLGMVGGFTMHWVDFKACSGEDPPQYDPFCGTTPFREIELGLAYSF